METTHEPARYGEHQPDSLLSERTARERLGGISRPTLWRLRQQGELTCVRVGRRILFSAADLDDYITRHRETVR
jgi:excisionase family DNA binding protein